MSLDIYLKSDVPITKTGTGIFIRTNGKTKELSFEEAKELYPNANVSETVYEDDTLYRDNITHNLSIMANEAGIYKELWRPEELGITIASELIEPLRQGLHRLRLEPDKYKAFNPYNGWGTYEQLVTFVSNYLDACYKYLNAKIEVSR